MFCVLLFVFIHIQKTEMLYKIKTQTKHLKNNFDEKMRCSIRECVLIQFKFSLVLLLH
jgi:hypothetical protein